MKATLLSLVFAVSTSVAFAQGVVSDKYESTVRSEYWTCSTSFNIYLNGEDSYLDKFLENVPKAKESIKSAYNNAVKLELRPNAKEALKNHYIAVLNALNGIEGISGETKANYNLRQSQLNAKMTEAWERYKLE
jgi:hypothetical protein